jgi:hypothetical protein
MFCEFENIPCTIAGNFTCKKCKTCGYQLGMATSVVDTRWGEIQSEIASKCRHRQAAVLQETTADNPTPFPQPSEQPQPQIQEQPLVAQPAEQPQPQEDTSGPGAHLKKYLSRIGINASPTCSCNARARYMDFMGTTWCENNLDTIVGWLKEESEKRGLPFIDWPARVLVKKAISSSKKAQAKQFQKQNSVNNDVQPPTA